MKRITIFLAVLLVMGCFQILSIASGSDQTQNSPVFGKYNYASSPDYLTCVISQGKGSVSEEGILINVDLSQDGMNGYLLVVHRIPENEKDATEWFKTCVPDAKRFLAYDIYLLDSEEQRVELPENSLITMKLSYNCDEVFGLSSAGNPGKVKFLRNGDNLSFCSIKNLNYYLICDNLPDEIPPQTSDFVNSELYIVFLAISSFCAVSIAMNNRQRNHISL